MRKFLLIFVVMISLVKPAWSQSERDGFYIGVDPTKMNNKIGNANKAVSVDSKVAEDRYYGYKFSEAGFFVAPEVALKSHLSQAVDDVSKTNNSVPNSTIPNVSYNVRANIGYEFDKSFSGFLTYDVGNFSYISGSQRPIPIAGRNISNNVIGFGSQVNFSNSFGVKFSYSQQQFDNSSGTGRIKSEVIKVGTVYSF